MEADNRLMVKNLQRLTEFYTVYSKATNHPFARCDRMTQDDQAYIFEYETDAEDFHAELEADHFPSSVRKLEKKDFASFYAGLYMIGVNGLVFHNGAGPAYLPIESVVKFKKPEQRKNAPPVSNESLQMTAVYFLQEVRRPGMDSHDPGRNLTIQNLEQELVANLKRSRFIIAFDVTDSKEPEGSAKISHDAKLPFLKTKNGDIMQPVFSDMWEFQKFANGRNRRYRLVALPFDKLIPTPVKEAKGLVVNPSGFNLSLTIENVERMTGGSKNYVPE